MDEAPPIHVITGEDGYVTVCFGSRCVRVACAGAVPTLPDPDRMYVMTLDDIERIGTGSLPPEQPIFLRHDPGAPVELDRYQAIAMEAAETGRSLVIDTRRTAVEA